MKTGPVYVPWTLAWGLLVVLSIFNDDVGGNVWYWVVVVVALPIVVTVDMANYRQAQEEDKR